MSVNGQWDLCLLDADESVETPEDADGTSHRAELGVCVGLVVVKDFFAGAILLPRPAKSHSCTQVVCCVFVLGHGDVGVADSGFAVVELDVSDAKRVGLIGVCVDNAVGA